MEFIESLTARVLTAIPGAVAASPLLVVAALVLAVMLCSGLAARIVEAFEERSGSFDRVRRVATNRLRAVASGSDMPLGHHSTEHVDSTTPHLR